MNGRSGTHPHSFPWTWTLPLNEWRMGAQLKRGGSRRWQARKGVVFEHERLMVDRGRLKERVTLKCEQRATCFFNGGSAEASSQLARGLLRRR